MVDLGIINAQWIWFSLAMMPFAIVSTFVAPHIVKHINQNSFPVWFGFHCGCGDQILF